MKLILVMAITVDGKIALHNTHFPDWTCSEDKRMFRAVTQQSGVVIMGSRTYQTIGKPLPKRLNVVLTRQPRRYAPSKSLIYTNDPPGLILEKLSARGYDSAALIGGEMINNLFAQSKLIDEIIVTVAPTLFGTGLSLFSCPVNMDLALISLKQLESDHIMLHYRVTSP
jgi:dihydrofolate reductase